MSDFLRRPYVHVFVLTVAEPQVLIRIDPESSAFAARGVRVESNPAGIDTFIAILTPAMPSPGWTFPASLGQLGMNLPIYPEMVIPAGGILAVRVQWERFPWWNRLYYRLIRARVHVMISGDKLYPVGGAA